MEADLTVDRVAAYTTARSDVAEMVPPNAMSILDVGCSNGALGASLRSEKVGRYVCGIEFDAGLARDAATRLNRVIHANLDQIVGTTRGAPTNPEVAL